MIQLRCDGCNAEGPSNSEFYGGIRMTASRIGWAVHDDTGRDFCPNCRHQAYYEADGES